MFGILELEGVNDVARLVERERGLGEVGDAVGIGQLQRLDLGDIRNHVGYIGRLAQRALDFVVVAVADEHQRIPLLGEFDGLKVHLGYKRAGGVDHLEVAAFAALADGRRNAVRRVDHALAVGHVVDLVDKDRAFFRQLVHNIAVMDDLAAHVNGRAEGFKGDFDDVDGAHHAGAKTARFEQQHPLLAGGSAWRSRDGEWIRGQLWSHP